MKITIVDVTNTGNIFFEKPKLHKIRLKAQEMPNRKNTKQSLQPDSYYKFTPAP